MQDALVRLAEGEIDALDDLYNLLSVRIFNYARTIVKSKHAAEDITHDVFMRVLNAAARLSEMQNPVGYVMTITRNLSYDELRKGHSSNVPLDEVREIADAAIVYDELPDALSTLPAPQRETIYLHYICGFSQKEVAGIMRVPLVTVKWRCKKAKQNLHKYFDGGSAHESIRVHN